MPLYLHRRLIRIYLIYVPAITKRYSRRTIAGDAQCDHQYFGSGMGTFQTTFTQSRRHHIISVARSEHAVKYLLLVRPIDVAIVVTENAILDT